MTVVHHPPYFSLFPLLKIKLKDRHFDTNEVIEAESEAVLNTLTEPNFQDAFKMALSIGNDAYMQKGTTSRVVVFSRPKVSFLLDGGSSPGNYGWFSVHYTSYIQHDGADNSKPAIKLYKEHKNSVHRQELRQLPLKFLVK
jgi:hypothetical protein